MAESKGHVLLLAGSPKPVEQSGSAARARTVINGLEERGWTSETVHLQTAVASDANTADLLAAVDRADAIILAAPLYVDSLPAPTLHALERIAAHRRDGTLDRSARFVSILLCGFVEPSQNATCQLILERFAERAHLGWVGGVSLGGGGAEAFGKRRIREALRLIVEAIDEEILLSFSVDELTEKPTMPSWLYVVGGNAMWKKVAKQHGAEERLRAKPYERPKA